MFYFWVELHSVNFVSVPERGDLAVPSPGDYNSAVGQSYDLIAV